VTAGLTTVFGGGDVVLGGVEIDAAVVIVIGTKGCPTIVVGGGGWCGGC